MVKYGLLKVKGSLFFNLACIIFLFIMYIAFLEEIGKKKRAEAPFLSYVL